LSTLALQVLASEVLSTEVMATEEERHLPAPAEVFGAVTMVIFLLLLAITLAFNRDR